jgi:universal stress protein E
MSDIVLAIIELDNYPDKVAERAAWLARLYGCRLHMLLSDPSAGLLRDTFIVSNEARQISGEIERAQLQLLEELAASIRSAGDIDITSTITHDRPAADAIIAKALELEPRFVVKGTQYHSAAERAMFAYTDWRLIRKLCSPLWIVRPVDWEKKPVIVAAVDPVHEQDKEGLLDQVIVRAGKEVAARCGGELMLLHTYHRLIEIGDYAKLKFKPVKLPIEDLDKKIQAEHRQKLDALAAANGIPAKAVHQLPGRTHELLPTFARAHGASLVVMGAVARSGLKQRTIGSTAERVLDHLHCDTLIVHSG